MASRSHCLVLLVAVAWAVDIPAGYEQCASENKLCACSGQVIYGNGNGYTDAKETDGCIECNNRIFPNSIGGAKHCYCLGQQDLDGNKYATCRPITKVATEWEMGTCDGEVRYGNNKGFTAWQHSDPSKEFQCCHAQNKTNCLFKGMEGFGGGLKRCECRSYDWVGEGGEGGQEDDDEESDDWQASLLRDMLPPPSPRCKAKAKASKSWHSSSFEFPGDSSQSGWNNDFRGLESDVFLAQMQHIDENENRTWSLRVGQGGNPYSFIGAFGEAMPPQNHVDAPWVDEVWQMTTVDQARNTSGSPYSIRQAGVLSNEAALRNCPFYSPSVARACDARRASCAFASWGQQAHAPSPFASPMLYYTRYQDCGDGVIEVTWMMHNMAGAADETADTVDAEDREDTEDTVDYLSVPWGGVRTSTLRDVVIEDSSGDSELLSPLPAFASQPYSRDLRDFGGYTAFAQELPRPVLPIAVPAGVTLESAGGCTRTHADGSSQLALRLRLKPTTASAAGGSGGDGERAMVLGNAFGHTMALRGVRHWAEGGEFFEFLPEDQDAERAVANCNAFFKRGFLLNVKPVPERSKRHDDNLGLAFVHGSEFPGSFDGDDGWERRRRRNARVRLGATDGKRDFTAWTVNAFNKVPTGASYAFRQSLIVDSFATLEDRAKAWAGEARQTFYGANANANANVNDNGRAIGLFDLGGDNTRFGVGIAKTASAASTAAGGAAAGAAAVCGATDSLRMRCSGRTTPHTTAHGAARALFAVTCGRRHYVGHDRYHFQGPAPAEGTPGLRPYVDCGSDGLRPLRPTWKLLGFFEPGQCTELEVAELVSDACKRTMAPTKSPTVFQYQHGERSIFRYWGKNPVTGNAAFVFGQPIDGKDIYGHEDAQNSGSAAGFKNFHGGCLVGEQQPCYHGIRTEAFELEAHGGYTNCENFHASAHESGLRHCKIGPHCGPCPIKIYTPFPTSAPTPAPTIPVPHPCVRKSKNGTIFEAVAYGWAGIGLDDKYCILEQCQQCQAPTKREAPYDDQEYCDLVPHADMSESGNGACGKHQYDEDCEFVTCTFMEGEGIKVFTRQQAKRGKGKFPETGPFLTGDQHECRARHSGDGRWECTCKCSTTPNKWQVENSAAGDASAYARNTAPPTASPTYPPTPKPEVVDFSFSTVQGFFHSQNLTGAWSKEALKAITKYPIATTEKGMGGFDGHTMAETKIVQSCLDIKAAAREAGTRTKALYYWNGGMNWYHYGANDLQKEHPQWFVKKADGEPLIKVQNGNQLVYWFDFTVPAMQKAWKENCLKATRSGCDGCFIDNSQHMGQYMTKWGLSKAQALRWEQAHADTLNELNKELKAAGKLFVNNNVGRGINTAASTMVERFGPTETCLRKMLSLRKRGLAVEAHAGSRHTQTGQTCKNGDTNALAVFLLGMGENTYYACSMKTPALGSSPWVSGITPMELYEGKERWNPSTWRNANGDRDYWLHWRRQYDYPLGKPKGEARKTGDVWKRTFAEGTVVKWNAQTLQGKIRWGNGVTETGVDLSLKKAKIEKQNYCSQHRNGLIFANLDQD